MIIVQVVVLVALVILSALLIGLLCWSVYSIWLLWFGAPFVRSEQQDIATMIELAELTHNDHAVDIGCGDGAVLVAVAQQGVPVSGFDINPVLVWRAQERLKKHGLQQQARVFKADLWSTNLAEYSVVFLYGITYIMPRLEQKLLTELKPGSRVVSNYFKFPQWSPRKGKGKINLYIVPDRKTAN